MRRGEETGTDAGMRGQNGLRVPVVRFSMECGELIKTLSLGYCKT